MAFTPVDAMTSPPAATPEFPAVGRRVALLVFIAFASGHFLSYGLRTLNAALAPYLVSDLGLSAGDLGWLTASYFIAFAGLQYPLGFWLDRYGERRVEAVLLLIAAGGAALMALADTLAFITWGRVLIGLGVAACLMAPFAWFRRHFPPQRQSQLGLWLLVAGTLGAVMSTLPAATLANVLGWRGVLLVLAGLLVVSAGLVWCFVPDPSPRAADASTTEPAPGSASAAPIGLVRNPAMLNVMALAFFGHGGIMALQTLWAGPWMTDVLGIAPRWAASYLFVFTLAILFSYTAMSFITPRLQQRGITLLGIAYVGHSLTIVCLLAMVFLPYGPAWVIWPLMALLFPAMSLMQPGMSLLFPRRIAGRVLTLYNLYLFSGAFVVQWGIGLVVDGLVGQGFSTPDAYRTAFLALATAHALSLIVWRWRSGPPRSITST